MLGFIGVVVAVLVVIGFLTGVIIAGDSGRRSDMAGSLETTSGVVYRIQIIEGEEGVLIGKDRQATWLSHQDLRELIETLEIPADIGEAAEESILDRVIKERESNQ